MNVKIFFRKPKKSLVIQILQHKLIIGIGIFHSLGLKINAIIIVDEIIITNWL